MFTGQILSGNWDTGCLEITGMPKDFMLSARKLVVMEVSEYDELAGTEKRPESELRAILCVYCDTHIIYEPKDRELAYKKMKEHDRICPQNPTVQKLAKFKSLEENCWDLRCEDEQTGGDDYDIRWIIVEHYQAEPKERTIGQGNTPLEAIEQALKGR